MENNFENWKTKKLTFTLKWVEFYVHYQTDNDNCILAVKEFKCILFLTEEIGLYPAMQLEIK